VPAAAAEQPQEGISSRQAAQPEAERQIDLVPRLPRHADDRPAPRPGPPPVRRRCASAQARCPTADTGAFVTKVSNPLHGTAVLNADGSFTYTGAAGFTGTDTFQYTVTDDAGATSNTATVSVRVNVPTAADDLASFNGTAPVTINVLENDTDPDGNQHIDPTAGTGAFLTKVSNPQHGTAVLNADGTFTYTANPGFTGTDTFQYTVTDDAGATSQPATVTVVGSSTGPGTTNNDFTDTDGTTPVTVPVLANDVAPTGATFVPSTVTVTARPLHGTATVNPSTGAITYTAGGTFTGTDTFQYTVLASNGLVSSPTTVSVRVNRPVAADDWVDTDGTNAVNIPVLANDTDPDGNQHIDPTLGTGAFVTKVSNPLHGTATLNADGSFTYTGAAGFTGTDSFQYTVTDDAGATSMPATVFVRVNVPTAADDFAQTSGTNPVTIAVLENDTDPDGNQHIDPTAGTGAFLTLVAAPQHGTAVLNADGTFTYTPNPGWMGTDTFRYTVTDDAGATSQPATVTVNTMLPTATPVFGLMVGATNFQFNAMSAASDPLGKAALAQCVLKVTSAPHHGQVIIDAKTGTLQYVPNPGFIGQDSFSYTITDGTGATSRPATVTVDVLPQLPPALLAALDQIIDRLAHHRGGFIL
jgi:hypothetical protein